MTRYKAVVAYDGSGFSGYQVQPGKRTVQREIEAALKKIHKGNVVRITASGRTDAGVHAKGQVIHFDSPFAIPPDAFRMALETRTPRDISFRSVEAVADDFHARFDTTGKEYQYVIKRSELFDPFMRHFAWHYPYPLDLLKMEEASRVLIGEHDFTSFCRTKTEQENKVRTIYAISIEQPAEDILTLTYRGNGFLYNMVRILTGALLDSGQGRLTPQGLKEALDAKNREALRSKTAPPEGLYLMNVFYDEFGK
ncbi:tRNA pseudouridine synthase A [Listeria floridensis FSL S10-1187]|uniref:tRNA pseudouridine synthase A n=1 Tax=Listeria floridensis FSL S10-1187 TaxID=1265817 RepID=A0ABN0RIU7_9LIST|nr:tRNA pseudouridine(38-40) synthase TruA [Listeria floridensis]EUJ33875.1 tRNA pseudouridine synthase A [Listeria floridensis FSL S10-1187]